MASYRVAVTEEHHRPLSGVVIEAVSLNSWPDVSATQTTGDNGAVEFTNLSGPHWFRARALRVSTTVGDRTFSGEVNLQIVSSSGLDPCYDAVVDCDGHGTHTTLAGAITSALAASGNHYTILICCDITLAATIDVGGIDKTILIVGLSPSGKQNIVSAAGADRWAGPTIAAPANDDMFKQTTGKSGNDRGLILSNVGLAGQDSESIFLVATGDEIDFIEFDACYFGLESSGGTYLVSNGLAGGIALGNLAIGVYDCGGTLAGFYENNSTPPDSLVARDNNLTMTRWWTDGQGGGNQGNAADFSLVEGGYYIITNPMTIGAQDNHARWEFSKLTLQTGCSGAAFRHDPNDTNHSGVRYSHITLIATASDTDFGDFQGPGANQQDNLYIVGIHGVTSSGVTPSGTFLTVDSDITNPYVADIWAPEWETVYSGPSIESALPPPLGAIQRLQVWVADDTQNPSMGSLPVNSYVVDVGIEVTEAFDSDGTDEIRVGYDADEDAFATLTDVSTTGIKSPTMGTLEGFNGTARAVEAYYVNGGSEPSTGKALVTLEFFTVDAEPA